jgi:hypothetical protein
MNQLQGVRVGNPYSRISQCSFNGSRLMGSLSDRDKIFLITDRQLKANKLKRTLGVQFGTCSSVRKNLTSPGILTTALNNLPDLWQVGLHCRL